MAIKYSMHVKSAGTNGTTGHHTVHVYIHETLDDGSTFDGIVETFGIESTALESAYGGNIDKWREWVTGELLSRHKKRRLAHAEISQWMGKDFDIAE